MTLSIPNWAHWVQFRNMLLTTFDAVIQLAKYVQSEPVLASKGKIWVHFPNDYEAIALRHVRIKIKVYLLRI